MSTLCQRRAVGWSLPEHTLQIRSMNSTIELKHHSNKKEQKKKEDRWSKRPESPDPDPDPDETRRLRLFQWENGVNSDSVVGSCVLLEDYRFLLSSASVSRLCRFIEEAFTCSRKCGLQPKLLNSKSVFWLNWHKLIHLTGVFSS